MIIKCLVCNLTFNIKVSKKDYKELFYYFEPLKFRCNEHRIITTKKGDTRQCLNAVAVKEFYQKI